MGSVMHFQRTLNLLSRGSAPGYLAVFIGGFGDVVAGCLSRVEKRFPGFLPGVAHATAYYHWDGGGCGVFLDRCGKIAAELEELRRECPGLPIVLIGHSYGGSCAVEVARRQSVQAAPLCLLTIDAVARRQKNARPACVEWWGNAYLRDGGGFMDVVPRIGGRWGTAPGRTPTWLFPATGATGRAAFIPTGGPLPCCMKPPRKKRAAFFRRPPHGWKAVFRADRRGAGSATGPVRPTSPVGKEAG